MGSECARGGSFQGKLRGAASYKIVLSRQAKRLPFLKGQSVNEPREHLFVAIEDFSRSRNRDFSR